MKTLLAVLAHPDDESFIFGGTLAMHVRAGGKAGILCLTDGQAGRTGGLCSREELGRVRREELRRAVAVLGIPHLFTPGLMDGGLDAVGDEAGTRLVRGFIERFGADVLYTFGPEGASGHADHKACHRWTVAAAGGRPVYVMSWPVGVEMPRRAVPLPPTDVVDVSPLGDLVRRAFLEHKTQADHSDLNAQILKTLAGQEYYHRCTAYAPPSP
ncbi:MAG TPA: PIG-L family deacetylase [Planctomycetota bacterium]|nr:PIG-L family deacetylase [Planctomycetota bacterium]